VVKEKSKADGTMGKRLGIRKAKTWTPPEQSAGSKASEPQNSNKEKAKGSARNSTKTNPKLEKTGARETRDEERAGGARGALAPP